MTSDCRRASRRHSGTCAPSRYRAPLTGDSATNASTQTACHTPHTQISSRPAAATDALTHAPASCVDRDATFGRRRADTSHTRISALRQFRAPWPSDDVGTVSTRIACRTRDTRTLLRPAWRVVSPNKRCSPLIGRAIARDYSCTH